MVNPFAIGADFTRLALESWSLAIKAGEVAIASDYVIRHRLGMMAAAGMTPTTSDLREMQLMVSEKVDAFGKVGTSLAKSLSKAGSGNVLDAARTAVAACDKALRPVHRASTANAKRLKRSSRRPS